MVSPVPSPCTRSRGAPSDEINVSTGKEKGRCVSRDSFLPGRVDVPWWQGRSAIQREAGASQSGGWLRKKGSPDEYRRKQGEEEWETHISKPCLFVRGRRCGQEAKREMGRGEKTRQARRVGENVVCSKKGCRVDLRGRRGREGRRRTLLLPVREQGSRGSEQARGKAVAGVQQVEGTRL